MKLVTTARMRALEQATSAAGVSEAQLMEQAGSAVAHAAAAWLANPSGRRLLALIGKGNNGGDALIAARVLHQQYGAQPRIYLIADRGADPLLDWATDAGVETVTHRRHTVPTLRRWLGEAEVVLDGLLGIGGRLPLEGAVADVMRACAEVSPPGQRRIALDMPTGVQSDTGRADEVAFRAQLTLTTGPAKPGLFVHPGADRAGRVKALDIGLSGSPGDGLERVDLDDAARMLPARPDDSHKGTFGKVLVIAGSSRYVGAAHLAAAAAVRAGAGLVTLAVPAYVQAALGGRSVETTFLPLPEDPAAPHALTPGHLGSLLAAAREYNAVALGPGIGAEAATRRLVLLFLEHLAADHQAPPLLIDADGLNALGAAGDWPRPKGVKWVLTPHPGEMGRLTGLPAQQIQADRLGMVSRYAAEWGQVLLLKGAPSIVAEPGGRARLLPFANAALATAGAGDVLSGTIAALLAQGCQPFEAAVAGGYVHGLAAELWRSQHGEAGLAASGLLERLPAAQAHLRPLR